MKGAREREERLRRRREQYRARRDRESEEERQARLARHREYERRRYAAMTTEQRRNKMTHALIKQFLLFCSLTALDANYVVLSGSPHDVVSICLI